MPRVSPLQSNFSGGEISPLLYGRVDAEKYATSLGICHNYIPVMQGGLTRRPGSYFVAHTRTDEERGDVPARLLPFKFSTIQAYALEFTHGFIRFFRNNAPILFDEDSTVVTYDENGNAMSSSVPPEKIGTPYEIPTPYAEHELFEIKFVQSADVLYLTHPNHRPMKLSRFAHTNWHLQPIDFIDGPYLDQNVGATTLQPAATTGNGVNLTASTGIFKATDVGRSVRIRHTAVANSISTTKWGWGKIVAYTSSTVVKIDIKEPFQAATAVTLWRLGLWSKTTGWPSTVTFHENRLFFAGSPNAPQRLDGSKSNDYENFQPTLPIVDGGEVLANNAVSAVLNSEDVNNIRWMSSDEKGLQVGTVGNEFTVKAPSNQDALSAINITAKRTSAYGSANVQPLQVGKATLFVQSAGRKLRDLQYYYDVDGFRAMDLTLVSEHITAGGLVQLAFQKEPQQIIWAVRADGVLLGMTYERDNDALQAGWHRHSLGGVGNPAGDNAKVESIAVIPSPDGSREEVWIVVRRYNKYHKRFYRTVEYMTKLFETEPQEQAYFVDCGLSFDNPVEIEEVVTYTSPMRFKTFLQDNTIHQGDLIQFSEMGGAKGLMGKTYKVGTRMGPYWFEILEVDGTPTQSHVIDEWVDAGGGVVRKLVTKVSGLEHLNGEIVSILADGAVVPPQRVTNNEITLPQAAAVIHIGHGYSSEAQMLRIEAGSADGTALGKTRRIHRLTVLLHRTLGLKVGINSFEDMNELNFGRKNNDLNGRAELFSGLVGDTVTADYDTENLICLKQDQPVPGTILAVAPQMAVNDRG